MSETPAPKLPAPEQQLSEAAQAIVAEIVAAGDEVRALKKAKEDFKPALAKLQAAKAKFKTETGSEYVTIFFSTRSVGKGSDRASIKAMTTKLFCSLQFHSGSLCACVCIISATSHLAPKRGSTKLRRKRKLKQPKQPKRNVKLPKPPKTPTSRST